MIQKKYLGKSAIILSSAIFSCHISAAGFQLNEHSSVGLGRAFSGESAIADNAASGNRNPATMTMFQRPVLSLGVTYVTPKVTIDGTSPKGNSLRNDNITPSEAIPNLHYIHPINDKFAVGMSIVSNYGLSTEFNDDYAAGMLAGTTKLTTGALTLNGAYRLNQHLSFGAGINAVYADAKIVRHGGELGDSPMFPANRTSEIAYLSGDKWSHGWNLGLLYEVNENTRFGLSYRSRVKLDFKGDYRSALPSGLNVPGLPKGTDGKTITGYLDLELPEIWEISAWHRVAPKWAVHYGFTYTGWNSFEELRGLNSQGDVVFHKDEGFKNNIRMSLGTTYDYSNDLTLRAGIAFDDSAAPPSSRSISIPDQDRLWLSAGTTYRLTPAATVDLGLAYMHGQNVTFSEKAGAATYEFNAKGTAWMYGANLNYTF